MNREYQDDIKCTNDSTITCPECGSILELHYEDDQCIYCDERDNCIIYATDGVPCSGDIGICKNCGYTEIF